MARLELADCKERIYFKHAFLITQEEVERAHK